MNYIDAQTIATWVNRYNELKRNKEEMERDAKELLKGSDFKREYKITIDTNGYRFTYNYTNESPIAFLFMLIERSEKVMQNLLRNIEVQ